MRAGTFAAIVLLIVLGSYAALLAIGASPLYCAHSIAFTDTAPCGKAKVSGQTADVLLVGDSSLLYGIEPKLVAAGGGGSVYNLGTVGPSFGYDPARLIDTYLARNARPKAIILYFAPWHVLAHDRLVDPQWFPLALALLQRGNLGEFGHFLRLRPSAIVDLPPTLLMNLRPGTRAATGWQEAMAREGGYLDYAGRGIPPLVACTPGTLRRPPYPIVADNRAAIAALKVRYGARGIPVQVMIAPWAACDGYGAEIERAYAGIADIKPEALPDRLFAADTPFANHVHASPEGVDVFSRRVADFIRTRGKPAMTAP